MGQPARPELNDEDGSHAERARKEIETTNRTRNLIKFLLIQYRRFWELAKFVCVIERA